MSRSNAAAKYILHPTDFSAESNRALAHALRLALENHSELVILHVGKLKKSEHFPSVRELLEQWEMLEPGAPRTAVGELGIGIQKIEAFGRTVVGAIANYLRDHRVDMLVMATHGRHGLSTWFDSSKAEAAARRTEVPTLFVPADCRGCVSEADGTVSMKQILVPVDHHPRSDTAVARGLRALSALGNEASKLTLLHVGDESRFPHLHLDNDWDVSRVCRQGSPVKEILAEAEESLVDLIIMTTEGRHGFYDALRGTTTEQVLHGSPCPMLAVPANPKH